MGLRSLNKVTLLGTLGKDPEGGETKYGGLWCGFSIATSESYKDKETGEWNDITEWHNVRSYNERICKLARYLKKGSKVLVEGQMKTSKYNDKNGVEKYSTKVEIPMFGGELVLLDKKEDKTNSSTAQEKASKTSDTDLGDSIPW